MRVISGEFKSRRLKTALLPGIRPTSDKLKETVFNILGASVDGATFLDGCAGVGAIGIEAISRRAVSVYFVEQSRKACQVIRENLQSLGVLKGFLILETDLIRALSRMDIDFDIAFIDPPYDREDLYLAALDHFGKSALLKPDGQLILEHSKRKTLPDRIGELRKIRSLVQGDAALAFYRPARDM